MEGHIYIDGPIGDFMTSDKKIVRGFSVIDLLMQLGKCNGADLINVWINSPGGNFKTGFDLFEILHEAQTPIKTINTGMVGSIATIVYAAGHERSYVSDENQFFTHLPQGAAEGTATQILDYAKNMDVAEKCIISFYEEVLGLGNAAVMALLKNETLMSPEQAKAINLVNASKTLLVSKPIFENPIISFYNEK